MAGLAMFDGQTAIVTGAGGGIGSAIAAELAAHGAHVLVQDLNGENAGAVTESIRAQGGSAETHESDITNPKHVREIVETAQRARGRIDILVNNAGLQYVCPIDDYPLEQWNRLLAVLVTAPFLLTQAVLPAMRSQKRGRIVNISSVNGRRGEPGKAAYCSAKHAIIGLTRVTAMETAADGITANAICPGLVMTPLIKGQLADLAKLHGVPEDEVLAKHFLASTPTGRPVETTEIASMVRYLASNEAASITGQAINVSGGLMMN